MTYDVILTQDAMTDLTEIYDFVYDHDSPEKACHIVTEIEKIFSKLSSFPERGAYPHELLEAGIQEYREVHFKPYRVIYRIEKNNVFIYIVADARRSLQGLLFRRLLNLSVDNPNS